MFTTYMYVSFSMLVPHQQHVFTTCRALHTDKINHRLKKPVHLEVKAGANKHMFTSHQQNAEQSISSHNYLAKPLKMWQSTDFFMITPTNKNCMHEEINNQ